LPLQAVIAPAITRIDMNFFIRNLF
jgi:hypothetical protein